MRIPALKPVGPVLMMLLGLGILNAQTPAQPGQMGGSQTGGMDMGRKSPAAPASPLRVTFNDKQMEWTPADLAALPHKTVTVHNEHTKSDETYSGVPLIDLLARVGVPARPMGKGLSLYLVAAGSDGYQVVYSVAEINPDVHDAIVIVADAQDGKPPGTDGPFKLVATREMHPSRWVRNLVAVRVMAVQ